jgi:hypothetical protein
MFLAASPGKETCRMAQTFCLLAVNEITDRCVLFQCNEPFLKDGMSCCDIRKVASKIFQAVAQRPTSTVHGLRRPIIGIFCVPVRLSCRKATPVRKTLHRVSGNEQEPAYDLSVK